MFPNHHGIVVIALKRRALDVDMLLATENISRQNAIVKASIAGGTPEYVSRDRAGRRHPSQRFVRQAWRQHLVLLWIETKLFTFAAHGHTQARVTHTEPDHRFNDLAFSMTLEGTPTYHDIRDEVFHPNSRADVTAQRSVITD